VEEEATFIAGYAPQTNVLKQSRIAVGFKKKQEIPNMHVT
jgi:hypothetical protein